MVFFFSKFINGLCGLIENITWVKMYEFTNFNCSVDSKNQWSFPSNGEKKRFYFDMLKFISYGGFVLKIEGEECKVYKFLD